jgi:putative oxidoreductase
MTSDTSQPTDSTSDDRPTQPLIRSHDAARALPLLGRVCFSAIFILSAPRHFSQAFIDAAASHDVPLPGLSVPLSGVIAAAGGLSILFGYKAKVGGWLLVMFLVPVTLFMHGFWAIDDPQIAAVQMGSFLRNFSMIGGALFVAYFGAGPVSVDAGIARAHVRTLRERPA